MILETERLILRPFTEKDAADAFEYLHEPLVRCFACMKTETMEDARKAVIDPKTLIIDKFQFIAT